MNGILRTARPQTFRPFSVLIQRRKKHDPGDRPRRDEDPENTRQNVRDADGDARRQGQSSAEVCEHLREDRHDEDQHEDRRDYREDEDHRRVGHGAFDLPFEFLILLKLRRDPKENLVQNTAYLPGPDHLDVEFVEDVGVLFESLGEGESALHVAPDPVYGVFEFLVRGLFGEGAQGADDRQTGVDHG